MGSAGVFFTVEFNARLHCKQACMYNSCNPIANLEAMLSNIVMVSNCKPVAMHNLILFCRASTSAKCQL